MSVVIVHCTAGLEGWQTPCRALSLELLMRNHREDREGDLLYHEHVQGSVITKASSAQ